VAVDGEDQCGFFGDFRAAMLPRVKRTPLERDGDVIVTRASHDGSRRLLTPATHERAFVWLPGDGLVVVDRIWSETEHEVVSSLPLAPEVRLDELNVHSLDGVVPEQRASLVAPYLGQTIPAVRLERRTVRQPGEPFGWALLRPGATARVDGESLAVVRVDGSVYRLEHGGRL
jgi:hypothetical protein